MCRNTDSICEALLLELLPEFPSLIWMPRKSKVELTKKREWSNI